MDGQKPEQPGDGQAESQLRPGVTIQPGQPTQSAAIPAAETPPPAEQPASAPLPTSPQTVDDTQTIGFFRAGEDEIGSSFSAAAEYDDGTPQFNPEDIVQWTASEFVAHHKTASWYLVLITLTVAVAVLVRVATHDIVSPVVVVLAGIILGSYANRKPRQLDYRVDPGGVTVGQRYYSFNDFKAFTIVHEGAFSSLVFYPMQRFGFVLTVYYDPADEERIFNLISQRIPYEQNRHDPIDNLMRRIRF